MKNKTTAGTFALFLGIFGAHHFYLGNKLLGVIYVLFCWTYIPLGLGIIEAILFYKMTDEEFDNKHNALYVAKKERIEKRKETLLEKYGEEIGQKIIQGEVWTGMAKEMLIDALGEPSQTKEDVLKTKIKEKFSYGEYYTDRGTRKFTIEVRLENDEVVGWKEF